MKITTITPEIAKKMLSNNNLNRSISQSRVNVLAKEISSNKWVLNGETIKTTVSGRLIDGQHRLSAIIAANKSIMVYLIDDLSDDNADLLFSTVDQGKQRTLGDILSCEKIKNSEVVSVAGTVLKWIEHTNVKTVAGKTMSKDFTKYDRFMYVKKHSTELFYWSSEMKSLYNQTKLLPAGVTAGIACYLAENGVSNLLILDFFKKFYLGFGDKNESPNVLRVFLLKKNCYKHYNRNEVFFRYFITLSWNAFFTNKQLKISEKQCNESTHYPNFITKLKGD